MISIAELRIAFIFRVRAIWSAAFNRSLVEIPPNRRISDFMRNLKYKYGNRHFWCRGYYVSTVGGNKNGMAKYIRKQEQEDMIYDQL